MKAISQDYTVVWVVVNSHPCFRLQLLARRKMGDNATVEPQYNEVPRDWENVFVINLTPI